MEPKTYHFSVYYCLIWLFNCCLWLYVVTRPLIHQPSPFWIFLAIAALILWLYRFCDIIYNYLIPLVRKKTALQLDNENLFYGIKRKVVRWDEIKEIKPSLDGVNKIKFVLHSGEKFSLRTNGIKGDNEEIYQSILAYFRHITQHDNNK